MNRSARHPRGSALFTVLAVVAIASMLGAVVLTAGDSTATALDRQAERQALRAAAWSGVQAVMAQLAAQRQDLLDGKTPTVTAEVALAEEGFERPVARLLPWDAAEADGRGAERVYLMPESAKVDLNRVDAEGLAAMGVPEATAQEIIARRGARPFSSVEELATLSTVTVAAVFGGDPAAGSGGATGGLLPGPGGGFGGGSGAGGAADARPLPSGEVGAPPPLAEVLTTLAFDPNVQVGLAGAESVGKVRINIGKGWSDEVGKALTEQVGQPASDAVKKMVEQTKGLDSDTALVQGLLQFGVPADLLPAALDVLTVSDDLYVPGRVDITRAAAGVLAGVPGIGKEKAAAVIAARAQLTDEERKSRAWPLTRGVLTAEEFAKAAPWITPRCTQWRVRVRAAIERSAQGSAGGTAEPVAVRSAVFEAVVDVSSDRPRLAYWREVTLMPIARAMEKRVSGLARSLTESRRPALPAADDGSEPEPPPTPPPPPPSSPSGQPPPQADTPPDPPSPPPAEEGTMQDRRRGRWKVSGGSP